tara:strand:+ start:19839 stop:20063 length:225 start_codon:yes stop_codon:yes gene_type:complete
MKDGKKVGGAVAAAIAALLYGGSQLMDMELRIQALEEAAGIEEETPALGKPGMSAPPIEDPTEEPEAAEEAVEE